MGSARSGISGRAAPKSPLLAQRTREKWGTRRGKAGSSRASSLRFGFGRDDNPAGEHSGDVQAGQPRDSERNLGKRGPLQKTGFEDERSWRACEFERRLGWSAWDCSV
jgi:hypothetical protein